MRRLFSAFALATVAMPVSAVAQTTYTGTRSAGALSASFTVTTVNTITSLQTIQRTDILSWSISFTGNGTDSFDSGSGVLATNGSSLTGDSSGLFFNYSGDGQFYFDNYNGSAYNSCSDACGFGYEFIYVNGTSAGNFPLAGNVQIGINAAPEPAAWAMMIGGLAVVGAARRRQRKLAALA